ncbi:DUF1302 domain-containing protein, partial [Pseudomonas aeruginosa]|nr:DUF1302 domain-containing protein [Pseudomonas aeruginosa]
MNQLRLPRGIARPSLLALCVAAGISPPAQAATWQLNDDWSATTNTTLSLGTSWALENPDKHLLTGADARSIGREGSGINYNGDDG